MEALSDGLELPAMQQHGLLVRECRHGNFLLDLLTPQELLVLEIFLEVAFVSFHAGQAGLCGGGGGGQMNISLELKKLFLVFSVYFTTNFS